MNILIVEDEKLSLNAIKHCVESLGHKAFQAENGEEAISSINGNKIDLVISDIMMPGISGLSLLSIIRNVYLSHIPVILISTLDNEFMRDSSQTLGADDFISKPFTIADIAFKINKHAGHGTNS